MIGIFTTKDLMRRVVAMDLDPASCLLKSVMTKNPHSAKMGTTILETMHSMHNGRFLHVPVFDEEGNLVGLVDVLQVTCGVLLQTGSLQVKNDSVQPLWDEFRNSLVRNDDGNEGEDPDDGQSDDHGDDSIVSSGTSSAIESVMGSRTWRDLHQPQNQDMSDSVDPVEGDIPTQENQAPDVFVFKLADCYGNNHRFTSSAESLKELLQDIQTRLGDHTIRRVHYVDDEGDHVSVLCECWKCCSFSVI